jgi:hypothetical protein
MTRSLPRAARVTLDDRRTSVVPGRSLPTFDRHRQQLVEAAVRAQDAQVVAGVIPNSARPS